MGNQRHLKGHTWLIDVLFTKKPELTWHRPHQSKKGLMNCPGYITNYYTHLNCAILFLQRHFFCGTFLGPETISDLRNSPIAEVGQTCRFDEGCPRGLHGSGPHLEGCAQDFATGTVWLNFLPTCASCSCASWRLMTRLIKLHDWLHDFDGRWDMLWYVGM